MKTRTAEAIVFYNGKNIKAGVGDFATAFSYEDPASSDSDTISLSLADPRAQWIGAWLPSKGDEISATIQVSNDAARQGKMICGTFTLDDFSFSESASGRTLAISGISAPLQDAFKATQRTRNWENISLSQIAKIIAQRYQMTLVFDAKNVHLSSKEQSGQSDSAFLQALCTRLGKSMKVFSKKLVIFDRETYKKQPATKVIDRADCMSFSWKTSLAGTYTGGTIRYSNLVGNRMIDVKIGSGKRLLNVNEIASSEGEARVVLQAAIDNANHSMTTASIQIMGDIGLSASQNITLTGFGKLSGKYYIDKKTDAISGSGYTSTLELSLIESVDDAVRAAAVKHLASIGAITNADYWLEKAKKIPAVSALLVNASTVIKANAGAVVSSVEGAVKNLTSSGVINSPDYWLKNYTKVPYCGELLRKLASAVGG